MRCLLLLSFLATLSLVLAKKQTTKVTDKVILEIEIGGKKLGKIELGLFRKTVPKTVNNFVELCKRPPGEGYKGTIFYLITPYLAIEGGDITKGDGSGGCSIYGDEFKDENFKLKHYGAGWLSMANTEKNKNKSQFLITLAKVVLYDKHHVVFGKVLKGMDVVREMERTQIDHNYRPIRDVVIAECTAVVVDEPFVVQKTDATE